MRPVTASGLHRQHRHVASLGLAKELKIDVYKLEEEAKYVVGRNTSSFADCSLLVRERGMTLPPGPE